MPLDSISGGCDLKRRIFLSTAAAATTACSRKSSSLRFFTPEEAAALDAWLDVLIPADQDPGARQAGVVNYIDIQLTRSKLRKLQPAYRAALAALSRLAAQRGAPSFEALSFEARTAIAAQLEQGAVDKALFSDGGKSAFNMVLDHAMQGFYGNPRHGGNKDYASWHMIGVPPMPVRGRQHYGVHDTFLQKGPVQG